MWYSALNDANIGYLQPPDFIHEIYPCFYHVFWKTVAKLFPFSLFREGISNAMYSSLTLLFA